MPEGQSRRTGADLVDAAVAKIEALRWVRTARDAMVSEYGVDPKIAHAAAVKLWQRQRVEDFRFVHDGPTSKDPLWVVQCHMDSDEESVVDPDDPALENYDVTASEEAVANEACQPPSSNPTAPDPAPPAA
jgi:hypothetical protein